MNAPAFLDNVARLPLAAPASPAVALRGFSRTFGDNAVLDALDLTIAHGEFVALLGRSGSGKTTLLRTLAGIDPARGDNVAIPSSRSRTPGCCRGSVSGATSRSAWQAPMPMHGQKPRWPRSGWRIGAMRGR